MVVLWVLVAPLVHNGFALLVPDVVEGMSDHP